MSVDAATEFASWERASDEEIAAAAREVERDVVVQALLEVVDGAALILDRHRQVLAANQRFLDRIGCDDGCQLLGMRPGECLDCAKVAEAPNGCGTAKACRSCGAVLAVIASQRTGETTTGECLMAMGEGGADAAEFRVRCTPLRVDGLDLTAVVLHDISADKRRAVLERLFLHDLSNTVGGMLGWGSLLAIDDVDAQEAAGELVGLARRMSRDIRAHAALVAAEEGELRLTLERLQPSEVLRDLVAGFRGLRGGEVTIALDDSGVDTPFTSDPEVLARVVGNMIVNAVEASAPGDVVRVWCEAGEAGPIFFVHNAAVMPEFARHQIFKRSFTTKGRGRGLGTYGMKLFGDRYLGGRVGFTSDRASGTTFWLALGEREPLVTLPDRDAG